MKKLLPVLLLIPHLLFSQEWVNDDSFLHTAFNGGAHISSTIQQPDGKIIVSGSFNILNGPSSVNIARLNGDGSLDTTFTPVYFNNFTLIQLQTDGKIVAGGIGGIRRYHANGDLDSTFNYLTFVGSVKTLSLQSDGKIIVGGDLSTLDSQLIDNLIRLNTDGTLDTTFSIPPLNPSNSVTTVHASLIQNDQKIIIAGEFTISYNGNTYTPCRLNPDGSFDTTFLSVIGGGSSAALALQPDGKLLLGYAGGVNRANSNGTSDNTFIPPATSNTQVRALAVLPDGKIFIGGDFQEVNGQYAMHAALLHPNGTLDMNQGIGNAFNGDVIRSIELQNNGRVLIAGGLISNLQGYGLIGRFMENLPQDSLTINTFSLPSSGDSCTGTVFVFANGMPYFTMNIGTSTLYTEDYAVFDTLCPGIYSLTVTDGNSNVVTTNVVVAEDSNYVFNNLYSDSIPLDSLGYVLENCEIYYPGIDTAYIDSIWADTNTLYIIWNIIDSNGSNADTIQYAISEGNGVYWLQLSVFCPNKSLGEYFTVTEAIYFDSGSGSTAGLADNGKNLFEIYPNPTNNQVHINFSGSDAELTIYDLQGKTVLKERIQNNGIVSLQNFEQGIYLFDFKNAQGHSVQRVMKQ